MKTRSSSLILAAAAFVMMAATALHAQTPAPATSGTAATKSEKSLITEIKNGGWVMIPILLCSVLTVYLVSDGIRRTAIKQVIPPEHDAAVKEMFRAGDYVACYNYCKNNPSPFTNVLRTGVSLLGEGKQVVEEGIIGEMHKEQVKMNNYINYLSVMGVCTPMIGLLGTVTGMMGAFSVLGSSGVGDPSALSAKIGEVLIATASGLFIAIPAFGFFYYLRNRSSNAMHAIQDDVNTLFRKMPYEQMAGVHIGGEELYANTPNWLGTSDSVTGSIPAMQ